MTWFSSLSTTATSAKTSRADYVPARTSGESADEVASDIVEINTGMFLCKHVGCILHSTIHAVPEGRSDGKHSLVLSTPQIASTSTYFKDQFENIDVLYFLLSF